MKVVVDVATSGAVLCYDKDVNRPAVMVSENNMVIEANGAESRVIVPVGDVTTYRMRAISTAMDQAEAMGYESGCLVVRGDKIGFFSAG